MIACVILNKIHKHYRWYMQSMLRAGAAEDGRDMPWWKDSEMHIFKV